MQISRTETCELPFILNLPNSKYQVSVDGTINEVELFNGWIALHLDQRQFIVGDPNDLSSQHPTLVGKGYPQRLRTVVRRVTSRKITRADLPAISDDQLLHHVMSLIVGEDPLAYADQKAALENEAKRRIAAMATAEIQTLGDHIGQQFMGDRLSNPDTFLLALNALIRLYMQRFSDFFVEEVTLHQLASQSPLVGIVVQVTCDGQHVHSFVHVGKVPPIMRKAWQVHPATEVDQFTKDLAGGMSPDSVALLEVRAKGFLERGATRSAVIEASAALELSVTRRLRAGFTKQGMIDTQIDATLKGEIHFNVRANKLMQQATGQTVSGIDNRLYALVLTHRDNYRHGIAHADVEPSLADATAAINDFENLRKVVDAIPV